MRTKFWPLFFVMLVMYLGNSITHLTAQAYEGAACRNGNPALKAMFQKNDLTGLVLEDGVTGVWNAWSSSLLKNTSKMPQRMADYDIEINGDSDKHSWSCAYSAGSVKDSNQETGWSEGVSGDGIGEILIVPVDTQKAIQIWAGLGKSKALFSANNRPKQIQVYFLDARKSDATQSGIIYSDIHIVGQNTQTLRDHFGFQSIGRPKHVIQGHSLIAIKILSIYPGSKWRDTVISEIKGR